MTALEATDQVVTPWRRFVGANIKGTPAMSADKVGADVEILRGTASIIVTQEVRWAWYWKRIGRVLKITSAGGRRRRRTTSTKAPRWKTAPSIAAAVVRPARAASAVMWKGRDWRRAKTIVRKLHQGRGGISETRWARAVLLVDWGTGLGLWAGTLHNVVGGDMPGDGEIRRGMLDHDLDVLDRLLDDLVATGHAIAFEIDANIRPSSGDSYRRLRRIIHDHGGQIIGDHGVEFLFVIPGRDTDLEVRNPRGFTIPPKAHGGALNTDHEARGMTFRLVRRGDR